MESLAAYKLEYEDMAPRNISTRRTGGKDMKMSKEAKVTEKATSKKYAKTRGEHFKDIVIAILVTTVIAFIAGVHYSDNKNMQVQNAVKAATTATAQPVKK